MSAQVEETARSAVPVVDLSILDDNLHENSERLREVLEKFRPADLGRDLSRRSLDDGIVELIKGYRMLGRLPMHNA